MEIHDEEVIADVRRRLRRVQGQVAGILSMIDEGRPCRDVVQQVAAASSALDRAGLKLLVSQMRHCLGDEEAARKQGYDAAELERLFLSLA